MIPAAGGAGRPARASRPARRLWPVCVLCRGASGYGIVVGEMDQGELKATARRMRRRSELRRREAAARRERAQEFGRVVAERLGAADATITRVWGFGSTYERSRPYRLNSDLDLAVEGGGHSALRDFDPDGEFEISLIELADQRTEFAEMVRSRGVLLYERQ